MNQFEQDAGVGTHLKAHGTKRRFGAGWARNSEAAIATGEVLVFMDDDAFADPNWLEQLLEPYLDPKTMAVGGPPLPVYESSRPDWFPANFDWVFGCAYRGMPTTLAPISHMIGANMSVRRSALDRWVAFNQSTSMISISVCGSLLRMAGNPSFLSRELLSITLFQLTGFGGSISGDDVSTSTAKKSRHSRIWEKRLIFTPSSTSLNVHLWIRCGKIWRQLPREIGQRWEAWAPANCRHLYGGIWQSHRTS